MFKKLLLVSVFLSISCCYNNYTANLAVKSCNLSYEEVQKQLPVLQDKNATLYLQVKEKDLNNPTLKDVLADAKEKSLNIIIWPLLEDVDGPWANDHNYEKYIPLMNKVTDYLKKEEVTPQYLVVNMENAAVQMDSVNNYLKGKEYSPLFDMLLKNINREKFNVAVQEYKKLVDDLHAKGYKVMITTYPYLIDDMQDGDPDIQDLTNVPISGIDWDAYTFTPYRTAYSGDLGVEFTPFIVFDYAKAAKDRYKEKARIALGIVGPTDHGPGFKSPEDLEKDVAAVKATGIKEIDLFFLKGMIEEEAEVKDWINPDVKPAIPYIDVKVTTARVFVRSLDKLLDSKVDLIEILKLIESLKADK